MKKRRHEKIIEIIENFDIETQDELLSKLTEYGFSVTQATISRDIKDLKLSKTANNHGVYRYAQTKNEENTKSEIRYISILTETITKIDYAKNIVVFRTHAGMAQAAAAAIDAGGWNEIVGSIAGDDTIMLVTRTDESAAALAARFAEMMKG